MPESTRRQIGKYQIQAELGRGGFGVVYSAYDPTVGRPVAVKILTAYGDPQLLSRFKNEAAAAGNLRHKNIVTIYDYGDDDGLPYIVMELLDGEDLNQIIAEHRPMPLLQKVSIMVQVADGLRSAHRAGVVHRDVKPGNIRLLPDGTVKLMDFGIARLVAGSAATRLTRQGHVIGTLYYMAPEQVMGEEVDALSDIFAYGSTYYELLTGKHPFQGSDPRSVFHKITAEDPEPIRNLVPDCPEALEKIVNRTLQKDRDLRYQSLRDVQVDTEPILIELRQDRAELLVVEAKRLYDTADLENAQTVLGEVFDLDSANREARQLREVIQSKLLNRLIRPKVDALIKKADEALSTRRFEDAIENFEAALRLERDSNTISQRLEHARELLSLRREMGLLIADARKHFSKLSFEGAFEVLLQVIERDPSNPEGQQLFDEVRVALTRREKERNYQEKVRRARELLQANGFDDAATLLDQLDPEFRDAGEVRDLAAQIRSSKEQFERQQWLKKELSTVKELLAAAQFDSAIKRVEELMNGFPDEVEPTRLFILAHKELAAHRKAQALENLDKELNLLTAAGHFEKALSLVARSLNTYLSEPRLLETQRRIEEEWAHHRTEAAIGKLLQDAERYCARDELEKAVPFLEANVRQYSEDPRIVKALALARKGLASKRRELGIATLSGQAQAQLKAHQYQRALDLIDRGLAEYGADERLTGIREKVAGAKAEWDRAEAIRLLIDRSQQLVARNDFKAALETLHSGLGQFPDEPQLAKALASTQEALNAKLREEAIVGLASQAQSKLNNRQYQSALESVERGLAEYGEDRRLRKLRDQTASAKAEWDRAETIRQMVEQAQTMVAERDFNGAIQLLEAGLKRFLGERSLTEALRSARSALDAKRRDDAINALCGQAKEQTGKREFEGALKTLSKGFENYGTDARLNATQAQVLAARAGWERSEAIRRAVDGSRQHVAKGQPENALQLLESTLTQYKDEPKLLDARILAQEALIANQREQAIESLRERAEGQLQTGAYQDAMDLLDCGLQEFGGDPRLAALRTKVAATKAESERRAATALIVENAKQAIAQKQFEKALILLESGQADHPGEEQIEQAIRIAREGLAAERHAEAIDALCAQAQAQIEERDFAGALKTIDRGEQEQGIDQRLTRTRAKVFAARAEWEAAEAARRSLEEAQACLANQDCSRAISLLEASLKQYPGQSQLTEALVSARKALEFKRRDEAIETLCEHTRGLIEKRDFACALKTADQGVAQYGNDNRFAELRAKVLAANAEWERAEAVHKALEDARVSLAQGKPGVAVDLLEGALNRYPDEAQLMDALNVARKDLDAQNREEAIATLIKQAQQGLQAGEFVPAGDALDRGLKRYGADRRLSDLRGEVLQAKSDWERARSLRQLVSQARQQIAAGQPESALELLTTARSQFGDDPRLLETITAARETIEAKQREQAIQSACESAQVGSDRREYVRALEILDEAINAVGKDQRLSALRDKIEKAEAAWERSQAIRPALEECRKRVSQNDAEAALEILNRELAKYPGEPQLIMALAETRLAFQAAQKERAIDALSEKTRVFIGASDFPAALAMVAQGLKAYGPEARLADLRETILAAQSDWACLDAIRQAVDEANDLVAQGAPDKASRLLEKALARFPSESMLLDALVSTSAAVEHKRRAASIEKIYAEARRHFQNSKFEVALQLVEKGLKESPDDSRLLELRESIAAEKAKAHRVSEELKSVLQTAKSLTERGQREKSIALLERALNEHPANPELVAAIVQTISAVGAAGTVALDEICRSAREHMLTGDFDLAFHTIEQALRLQNDEQQAAISLKNHAETAKASGAGSSVHRDMRPSSSVKEVTEELAPLSLVNDLSGESPITDEYGGQSTTVLHTGYTEAIVTPSPVQPQVGRNWKWPWLIVGAAVPLVALLAVIWVTHTPKLGTLQVRSAPAGATITVNNQTCSTDYCEFHLQPGQYRVQVAAAGFQRKIEMTTLKAGSQSPIVVTLEPLSPTIRLSANFADGNVVLDDRRAERMQDGEFVVDQLSPGRHNLRISGKGGAASLSFDAQTAKLPVFMNISHQNTDVLASGSFGKRAVIACPGCMGSVTMDDRRLGDLKDGAIKIDNVSLGTHRVKVGEDRTLVFSNSGAPSIQLAVNSNQNFGALVIEANEDNATVLIDGARYPRLTSRGQLSIPAEAKQHTIRLIKDGYRVDPPEIRAQLKRGNQFEARFNLVPEPGRLVVSQQLPGASVWIDQVQAGTVKPDGSFSVQVSPGEHHVEFRKDGYSNLAVERTFAPGRQITLNHPEAQLVAKAVAPPAITIPHVAKPDASAAEQADWQRIAGAQNASQLEDFLKSHPTVIHSQEAQTRLKELQLKEAAAERESAWNETDKSNKAAVQQFLAKYVEGSHAQDARTIIGTLEKQERDLQFAAQRAKEQASSTADATSIHNVLNQFEAAFNRKALADLQGLWRGMPKNFVDNYRNLFRDAKSLDFRLTPQGQANIAGDTATAVCSRSLKFVPKNGQGPLQNDDRVRVGLERSGSQWVIRSIAPF